MVKQTQAQALGRSGERWFQAQLPSEWIFQPPVEDIGLDGKVIIGTSESTGDLEFGVQIKTKRRWGVKDGVISVDGIKRETLRYWGSRLFPTMLVLYDASEDTGYWGWVYDILRSPIALLESPSKTVTLKVPAASRLDIDAWRKVRKGVEVHYENFVNSLAAIRLRVNVMPTVHALAMSLHLLATAQFVQPSDEDDTLLLQLGEITAHREVFTALLGLIEKFNVDSHAPHPLRTFMHSYKEILSRCVADVDALLTSATATVAWVNAEATVATRPQFIRMLTDLLVQLTGNLPVEGSPKRGA